MADHKTNKTNQYFDYSSFSNYAKSFKVDLGIDKEDYYSSFSDYAYKEKFYKEIEYYRRLVEMLEGQLEDARQVIRQLVEGPKEPELIHPADLDVITHFTVTPPIRVIDVNENVLMFGNMKYKATILMPRNENCLGGDPKYYFDKN